MKNVWALPLLLFLSVSCIKTAEQVNREKRFDSMAENLKDSQGLLAETAEQLRNLRSQIDKLNGRVEELEHKNRQLDPQSISSMNENVTLLKSQRDADAQQLTQIQAELKEQRAFLEKVTAGLAALSEKPKAASKKKSAKEELNEALALVKSGKHSKARSELEALVDAEGLTAGDNNKLLHGLGQVEFETKNFEKALVYFSKIYTKYPKASLAPSSLLYIAKSLKGLGKTAEAKEAFARVAEDYPDSKEAKEAKKEI